MSVATHTGDKFASTQEGSAARHSSNGWKLLPENAKNDMNGAETGGGHGRLAINGLPAFRSKTPRHLYPVEKNI